MDGNPPGLSSDEVRVLIDVMEAAGLLARAPAGHGDAPPQPRWLVPDHLPWAPHDLTGRPPQGWEEAAAWRAEFGFLPDYALQRFIARHVARRQHGDLVFRDLFQFRYCPHEGDEPIESLLVARLGEDVIDVYVRGGDAAAHDRLLGALTERLSELVGPMPEGWQLLQPHIDAPEAPSDAEPEDDRIGMTQGRLVELINKRVGKQPIGQSESGMSRNTFAGYRNLAGLEASRGGTPRNYSKNEFEQILGQIPKTHRDYHGWSSRGKLILKHWTQLAQGASLQEVCNEAS